MLTFRDVVSAPDLLMGVKAVWGRSTEPIMCFGTGGATKTEHKQYYSQARITAEKSLVMPFFLTIGGGSSVPDELKGRVVELVRSTGVYGDTKAMVLDPLLRERLEQWPVSVMLSEVYTIKGEPHLIEDLGFPNRKILTNAFDSVRRLDDLVSNLWEKLADLPIERRIDVKSPPGFRDPKKVVLIGSRYPYVDYTSEEGKRIWVESQKVERDSRLMKEAKKRNRSLNAGLIVCEACGYSDELAGMFDAHHLYPLSLGIRETRLDDLAILCPSCHRYSHVKAQNKLSPLDVATLKMALMPHSKTIGMNE